MRNTLLTTALLVAAVAPAGAQSRSGTVSVCGRYSAQCITAPVRPARFAPEVRLPGGTWISCARSCRDTLRDETVDFWLKRDAERGGGEGRRRR
jgi:hypothetical protein